MLFALNYSPAAARLLAEGKIRVDRFKCPDWADLISTASQSVPVYVHFDLVAGGGEREGVDWHKIETLLATTETPYVNLHLIVPRQTPLSDAGKVEQMIADVSAFTTRFGGSRVIVENVPYRGVEGKYDPICIQPQVFHQLLDETGAGLLLDISHARITAQSLGLDEKRYIEALPLYRLTELHVTGLHDLNGVPTDHLSMKEDDWAMFDWTMDKIRAGEAATPWCVAFEYGGITAKFDWRSDPVVIAAQVPRLYKSVYGEG